MTSADMSPQRLVDEEALREVCEAALYWSATPTTIAAVRKLLPDQVEDLLNDL